MKTEGRWVAAGTTSNKEAINAAVAALFERWEGGNQAEVEAVTAQVVDSLAQRPGFAAKCLEDYLVLSRIQSGRPL